MKQIKLSDGTVLKTSTVRRYVVFSVSLDSRVMVQKRSDDRSTIEKHHNDIALRRSFVRVITIDFDPKHGPTVLRDS